MNNELTQLMEDNLHHVWSERNASRRRVALEGVYASSSSLFEVGEIITGYDAINEKISNIVSGMPGDFIFTRLKPIIINNNVGRLIWGLGPKGQPPVATGMDIAVFENGKIKSLYVFMEDKS
ncbi:hypothetical protein HDF24_03135 [Mucilaginibacter sp. X4EP1]|uniref:hypothetical protein n=1 Tax=Mucilaginibacter sp. X4EP1 TaxID=2723092 RepID=UPI002169CECB|nr:hypothetical protein [Mucilaginibacter sp. X4EP1]MCS3812019.1 hypothetical protein [Mucilaginibacter sp. X4EP1]